MTFQRDGFAGPFDIISLNEAKVALEEVQNELSVEGANRFKLHLVLPSIDRIAHHPKLVAAVQDALGSSEIWLWSSDINTKKEQSTSFFAPHQDATYAGLSPSSQCVTAWLALSDPVGENEGCLVFYPGSHKLGQLPHCVDKNDSKSNMLALGQYIDATIMQTLNPPISIPLRAGQATLHSFHCVHASGSNNSPYPRVGLALRYMTCNVQQTKQYSIEMATWICGADNTIAQERAADIQTQEQLPYALRQQHQLDYFDVEPRLPLHPTPADFDRGRRAQKEAMEREDLNYFGTPTDRSNV